ncbi:MAG: HDOD domain-containing protein, partial [Phycisphaerales bacterium]|nr:HDOD domain-containing protein [Phycisphaerales bacterium]
MLDEILSCQSLPSLPSVAVRVIELTSNPDVSLDELARTIQTDQGLAAKVLRTVNSSFYGLRQQCSTIQKALVMLGLGPIKTLALGFSLVSSLTEHELSEEFDQIEYWRRALYTAVAAKTFAETAKLTCADEAFLGGLLQDVGQMAMLAALGPTYLMVLKRANGDHNAVIKLELEEFELQHADVGAMLAERWRLPPELVVPIKYHERPTAAPGEYAQIVRSVGIGRLAHEVLTFEQTAAPLRRLYSRCEQWFGLGATDVDDVMKRVGDSVRELKNVFALDTGPFANVEEVLEHAEQQMAELARHEPAMS